MELGLAGVEEGFGVCVMLMQGGRGGARGRGFRRVKGAVVTGGMVGVIGGMLGR